MLDDLTSVPFASARGGASPTPPFLLGAPVSPAGASFFEGLWTST